MLSFIEWFRVVEANRYAAMVHEELPDVVPEAEQIVVLMDKPKAVITNNDMYYVLFKTSDEVVLAPKTAIDKGKVGGNQLRIPRTMWKDFTLINHLLTRKEKMERFGSKPVWIIGANKGKWISNRETEIRRQKSTEVTPDKPAEYSPFKISQLKNQLTTNVEEDPEVSAARSWLKGT